jgi:hypothetical protein
MKKLFLVAIALVGVIATTESSAQSFEFVNPETSMSFSSKRTWDNTFHLNFKNVTTNEINAIIEKDESQLTQGHKVRICVGEYCYSDLAAVTDPTACLPGFTIDLKANINFYDIVGTSRPKFTVRSEKNPDDKIQVTVVINGLSSVEESQVPTMSVQPNPTNEFVTLTAITPISSLYSNVVIHNSLGEVVQDIALNPGINQIMTNTSQLPSGTYFFFVMSQGNKVGKGTFVVSR